MPPSVARLKRMLLQYAVRLSDWRKVAAGVRGDGRAEAAKLWMSILAGPVTSLRRLAEWQYPILLFDTGVRLKDGTRFACSAASDELFQVTPGTQRAVQDFLESELREGDVFVDAGANIGFFTVLGAKRTGDTGKVVAIEMIPTTAAALRRHVAMNGLGNVAVVEAALSSRAGLRIEAWLPHGRSGQARLSSLEYSGHPCTVIETTTTTLDAVAAELPRVDVLKIDIEGHEAEAFAGGPAILAKTRKILFEAWGDEESLRAERMLVDAGFVIRPIDEFNRVAERTEADGPGERSGRPGAAGMAPAPGLV